MMMEAFGACLILPADVNSGSSEKRKGDMKIQPVITECNTDNDYKEALAITKTYVKWLDIDLSFQNFDEEIKNFKMMYGPPGGAYLLSRISGIVSGGVGLRDYKPGICEMKRLYVYDDFKKMGLGRILCDAVIKKARELGYELMRLDTMTRLVAANALYESIGFYDIPPYRANPDPMARYLELKL